MGARHFRDLVCWQLSDRIKREVLAITENRAVQLDRDFRNDIRRSARSAPANIAEGFGRETHRDFAGFLSRARASLTETENHLHDALDCGYVDEALFASMTPLLKRALAAVTRLQSYLLRTPNYRRPL